MRTVKCWCAPVFKHTSQKTPPGDCETGVTQVLAMTWQRASPAVVLRTQPPLFTAYVLPAVPVTV